MYRVLVFMACLAVVFGASNTTSVTPSNTLKPTSTASVSTKVQTSTSLVTSVSTTSSMGTSTPTPTPTTTTTPTSTPTPTSTTTTHKPITTPTTKPKPTNGDYSVKNQVNGTYCLLAKLDVSFNISYYQNKTEKKSNETSFIKTFATFGMPFENFSTNGSACGSDKSSLQVSWPRKNPLYTFRMSFGGIKDKKNVSSGWEVTAVSLNVSTENNPHFTNATKLSLMLSGNSTDLEYLSGKVNGSYLCGVTKDYYFKKNMGMMMIKYAKIQPFGVPSHKDKEVFGEANNCELKPNKPEKNNNIVPIAVGCALAGLVLIVLIAYIIGRRKSQRGYEKV